ncbi:CoxG family protein [Haloferax sp. DFSO52]|uniref:CoxG family protein n=1 Tax=Haloferax sp. DFSO52 TaxID=3388505 RepID=UPI003A8960AA
MPEVTKEFEISHPVEQVWEFFNTPDRVAACVPHCQSVEQLDEDTFEAKVGVDVAYTSLTFDTEVEIVERTDLEYMKIEGKATPSGRMPGSATVSGDLELDGDDTTTNGTMTIQFAIRGRLGSLGESAFTHQCEKLTDEFLENIQEQIASGKAA